MKSNKELFKKNLQYLMDMKGVGAPELAEKTGVTPENVKNWLTGRNMPRAQTLKNISDLLGVDSFSFKNKDLTQVDNDYNLGDGIRKIEAMNMVLLDAVSEIIADQKKELVSTIRSNLEKMLDQRLNKKKS